MEVLKSKFSVIMANYNNGNYIAESIRSVIDQSYSNWELIVVDDASADNSIKVIQPFLNDQRIVLIKHKKNLGYGATQKTGADHANGELIGVLDADDVLRSDALEIMSEAYKSNPDCGLMYSTHYICDEDLGVIKICDWVGDLKEGETNIRNCKVSHFRTFSRAAYRQTAGFSPEQRKAVDRDIIYKLEEVTKLKFVNEPLYYYRKNEKGISQENNADEAHFYDLLAIVKSYKRRINTNTPNLSRQEIIEKVVRTIKHSLSKKKFKWAAKLFFLLFDKDIFNVGDLFSVAKKLLNDKSDRTSKTNNL